MCTVTTAEVEDPGAVVQHFLRQKYLITAIVGHSEGQITTILVISKLKFLGTQTTTYMNFLAIDLLIINSVDIYVSVECLMLLERSQKENIYQS